MDQEYCDALPPHVALLNVRLQVETCEPFVALVCCTKDNPSGFITRCVFVVIPLFITASKTMLGPSQLSFPLPLSPVGKAKSKGEPSRFMLTTPFVARFVTRISESV